MIIEDDDMSKQDQDRLRDQVQSIVSTLENPTMYCRDCKCVVDGCECPDCECETDEMSGFDYLTDALDIQYIVNSKKEFLGARVLVCFGGPNVWINTQTDTVEGYWWGDECHLKYTDSIGLHDACEEYFNCI